MAKIFVNPEKRERAEGIVALLTKKRIPQSPDEFERIEHFSRVATEGDVDLKKTDEAIEFFYVKLGGLLRTEQEQKEADKKKEEVQKKGKKDRLGLNK